MIVGDLCGGKKCVGRLLMGLLVNVKNGGRQLMGLIEKIEENCDNTTILQYLS